MVANIGVINPSNVEATAYISAVAAFAAVVLVVLLFLGRRWCSSAVFGRKCCDDILAVSPRVVAPAIPLDNAQFDALSKPIHYPERIFTFEASDSDDELRLRIQQDKEEVECHYEEKNENLAPAKCDVELVETALRETTIRETRIDDVTPQRAEYIHTLEAQSSIDSDVIAHNDTSLLCGEAGGGPSERGLVELTLLYDAPVRTMTVHMLQARGLPPRTTGQMLQTQVRIVLLPLKKQKFKSKIRNGENPQYMESFVLHKINPEDVHGLGLRIRIYGCERMRRQRLVGEAAVSFAALNFELENSLWLQLMPRQHHQPTLQLPKLELNHSMSGVLASPSSIATVTTPSGAGGEACSLARSDSASSCCSTRSAPELLLGLQYSPTTGHLSVEVSYRPFQSYKPSNARSLYQSIVHSYGDDPRAAVVLSREPAILATVTTPSGAGGEACSLARSDSASSCCSTRSAPELLLGLQYSPTTGHLSVEVSYRPFQSYKTSNARSLCQSIVHSYGDDPRVAAELRDPAIIATVTTPSGAGGEACSLARSDSASSCCSTRSAPELLLGLQYSPTTGHLSVEIIKGTHFRKLSPNKAPDTYVKLCLISSLGMEMGRCKSTTRRAHSNPLYKELFIFQVALFQLTEVTLMVSVWWRRSVKRNEMVGWFSLGHSPSGREEQRHWQELCERQGEQVQRWHVLLDS
ncbi:synaptotagmin-14 [Ostrinia furnacalis]|uniref:synaptotagmin-14 n=1 Tax=Ostrinia furnacalis TaxID=93504 RepID=UPI00103CE5BE|nr:synaptotagmin-14 [Ostrinia furnacalis]